MISDEAVEAAAKVMQAKDRSEGFGEYELYEYRDDAREILEAAAPYLIREAKAEAWYEGRDAGYERGLLGEWSPGYTPKTNPYRSQA